MRKQYYDVIFCDIDDTLIYGFWTDLMRVTWNIFRNNVLSDVLMWLQEKFHLYKVNTKLIHFIKNQYNPSRYENEVIFITVRKHNNATRRMIDKIFKQYNVHNSFSLHELASDCAARDKYYRALTTIVYYGGENIELNYCFIDDNMNVRELIEKNLEIDTFDPVAMREGFVG